MPLDMSKAAQNRQPQPTANTGSTGNTQYQGEVSQALATNTAQVIRSQVSQTSQVVGELATQRAMVADHLSDQMAQVLDQGSFWEEVCARTLEKLEGQATPSPFVIEPIDLPPMPESVTRYLSSSRQRYSLLPLQERPALVGQLDSQSQQPQQPQQPSPEPSSASHKGAELPPITSNGNSGAVTGKGFESRVGK